MPVTVAPKYWAEHLGMPYHQADIRELERPRREPPHVEDPARLRVADRQRRRTFGRLPDAAEEGDRGALEPGDDQPRLAAGPGLLITEPIGYLEFVALEDGARLVLTDSGGIQEETTVLGVPCLTLRTNTERPVTVTDGTNHIVGQDPQAIWAAVEKLLAEPAGVRRVPEYWDGKAAERVVQALLEFVVARRARG